VTEGVGVAERLGVLVVDGVGVVVGVCDGVAVIVPVLVVEMEAVRLAVEVGLTEGELDGEGEAEAQTAGDEAPVVVALPASAPKAQFVQDVELGAAHVAAPHSAQLVGVSAAAEPAVVKDPSAPRLTE
jgi:hypothetical protein